MAEHEKPAQTTVTVTLFAPKVVCRLEETTGNTMLVDCPACSRHLHGMSNLEQCCNTDCNKWGCDECFSVYGTEGGYVCPVCALDVSFVGEDYDG